MGLRASRWLVPAAATALLGARALAACGSDYGDGGAADASASDLPDRIAPTPTDDGGADTAPGLPSFCQGIVFYAALDGKQTPELGAVDTVPVGTPALAEGGKFGGALDLHNDAGAEGGAAVYYVERDGGMPVYPSDVGTVSLWYRGTATDPPPVPSSSSPVIHRAMATPPPDVAGAGIVLVRLSNRFGVFDSTGASTLDLVTFPTEEIRPFLRPGAFNHFVTSWRKGDASAPTATLVINGGGGQRFDDAGPDAPIYDAAPNEAGEVRVPYRGSTAKHWDTPDASVAAFRLGGSGLSASDGDIDDVAMWSRFLSNDEIAAIYGTNAPIGVACKLTK